MELQRLARILRRSGLPIPRGPAVRASGRGPYPSAKSRRADVARQLEADARREAERLLPLVLACASCRGTGCLACIGCEPVG